MKIKRFKLSLLIPLIFIIIGIYLGYCIFRKDISLPNQWTITDNSNINHPKYTLTEILVNEIKSVNKIVPLEVELSEEIIVNHSWGDIDLFEKIKTIKFFANCSYYIDLSSIKTTDIKKEDNNFTITISKPEVLSIHILSDKTIYNEPELGLLRFGDITLSPEEYGLIYNDVSNIFRDKMLSEDLYKQSITSSESAIKDLLLDLLGEDIQIKVIFM